MLFPTLDFALFFLVVAAALAVPGSHLTARKWVLVAASYVFYAQWNWRFCFLLLFSTGVSYGAGLLMGRVGSRRAVMAAAVAVQLAVLAWFKYFDFIVGSLNTAARAVHLGEPLPLMEVLLPVGISFFTFHGISYVVDVYRAKVAVCRAPQDMLLYMAFFPQLVAGPIIRSTQFLPQLAAPAPAPLDPAPPLMLILGGLFKKVVIANYLATDLVDPVFRDPLSFAAGDLVLAVYGYAVQIYCDFSAYTDIAIGLAALLGIRFPQNFDQPYRAWSPQDFWRRWHITLSQWLRDYLYIPLGGNRHGIWRMRASLMATMLLGGVWHGARWTFVAWGVLHGAALVLTHGLKAPRRRLVRGLAIVATFHFVCLAWLLFRAPDFGTAWLYLQAVAAGRPAGAAWIAQATPFTLGLILFGLGLQFVPPHLPERLGRRLALLPDWGLAALFGACVAAVDALGPDGVAPFIYFQF